MQAIESNANAPVQIPPKTKLRELDGYEEYLWLTENTFARSAMVLAELAGETTVEAWHRAVNDIQGRFPLLTARVNKIAGERPFFEQQDVDVPLRVLPLQGMDLNVLIAEELAATFGYGEKGLARFILCHGGDRSALVFVSHHVAFDGRTNIQVVNDLIATVAGRDLPAAYGLQPGLGEYLGLGEQPPYAQKACDKLPPSGSRFGLPIPQLYRGKLSKKVTLELRYLSRDHGTTLHGALVAALYLEGCQRSENWRRERIVSFSPIDLRSLLGAKGEAGMFMGVHPTLFDPKRPTDFWTIARSLTNELEQSRSKDAAIFGVRLCREVVADEMDPDDTENIDPKGIYRHDLMVVNYGDAGMNMEFGRVRVNSLLPGIISGVTETQSVSALTHNGALHVSLVSRNPIPGLLDSALARLSNLDQELLQ